MARDHRKLEAFKLSDELVVVIYQITKEFPASERFGLRSQLRRAAVSVPTNIVEGCAREPENEYLRFLDIAVGSAREVLYLVHLAARLEYLEGSDAQLALTLGDRVAGTLVKLRQAYGRR